MLLSTLPCLKSSKQREGSFRDTLLKVQMISPFYEYCFTTVGLRRYPAKQPTACQGMRLQNLVDIMCCPTAVRSPVLWNAYSMPIKAVVFNHKPRTPYSSHFDAVPVIDLYSNTHNWVSLVCCIDSLCFSPSRTVTDCLQLLKKRHRGQTAHAYCTIRFQALLLDSPQTTGL